MRARFSTRRRLIAAFSAVLAAFLAALVFQIFSLRRMETTAEAMRDHERQMRLAVQLENAVRDQYAHEGRFVMGETDDLAEYEGARARAVELTRALSERLDERDAAEWMGQIRAASAELDRVLREQVEPAVRRGDPIASITHARRYEQVARIEQSVDNIYEGLQQTASAFHREMVDLEESSLRFKVALLVLIPAFVAGAVFYLSRSVARPLDRLSEGAAAIAGGDLDARIDIDTPDEFGALAAKFNAMTAALKQHQEKLVESEKLAGIGRLAAGVAHELNNPLQVILGYLSLNRDIEDRGLAKQLATVETETLRCKEIVEGLLELSRPTAPGRTFPVDLRELCEDVSESIRVSLPAEGLRLSVDGRAVALADSPKIRQVVFNLLKNAVEAAGPAGDVSVLIGASGDTVEMAVRDSGPGLPPEAKARIFEPFFTTKHTGTGLGLAVSRAIARAHGGDIDVSNREPRGAVFTVRLPRAPAGRA